MSPDAATEFARPQSLLAFKTDTNSSVNITMTLVNGTKILGDKKNDGGDGGDIAAGKRYNARQDSIFLTPAINVDYRDRQQVAGSKRQ